MYYKIKKSVTDAMFARICIYPCRGLELLRKHRFEIKNERISFDDKPAIDVVCKIPGVGGWIVPVSFLQPVRSAKPKKSKKVSKSKK